VVRHPGFNRRTAVRVCAYAAAPLLVAALTGCSSSDKSARPDGPPAAVTPIGPFGGITHQAPAVQARLQNADSKLIARCMGDRKFTYVPANAPIPVDDIAKSNAYGLISPQTAAAQGYGIVDNALIDKAAQDLGASAQPAQDSPGFTAALTGTDQYKTTVQSAAGLTMHFDSDGCVTTAVNQLYGTQWNQVSFNLQALAAEIQQQVESSAPWTGAVARWSSCMDTRFHVKFATPDAARSTVTDSVTSQVAKTSAASADTLLQSLRPGEVRLATQDATCQQAVGLAAVAQTEQDQFQAADESTYREQIDVYSTELEHAIQMAASLEKA
jgi:hypothetical protein